MKMFNKIVLIVIIIFSGFTLIQCSDDDEGSGQMSLKITDAPIDDTSIKGAFVTVASVSIDGNEVEGFQKQTIDLTAYQSGNAKLLATEEVDAGTYSQLSIVLDYASDDSGNEPGCYVMDTDNMKHDLAESGESTQEITISKSFDVLANSGTVLVLDFDLRKALKHENTMHQSSGYAFVTDLDLQNSLRLVTEEKSGEIKGTITESAQTGDRIVVYTYKKGTYDHSVETTGQGAHNIMFSNAVTSSSMDSNGNYTLAFLEEGEYEIHVASYEQDNEGGFVFQGMVEANSMSSLTLNNINVEADATIQANIDLTGFINL